MHTLAGDGVITLKVRYEFELTLSVVSDDLATPWRLISLRFLVGDVLPDKPVLLHQQQKLFMHQLVQSRLYAEDQPLLDCYRNLHSFSLSLQLDYLNSQAVQLCVDVCGDYVKVEEYSPGHHLKVMYWRQGSTQYMSSFLLDQCKSPTLVC